MRYWAKDYTVCLKEPFEAQNAGGYLMYAVPAIYITIEAPRKGMVNINILERAKNRLRCLYKRGDVKPRKIEIDEKDKYMTYISSKDKNVIEKNY